MRSPLPHGETLNSIWAKFGDRCVLCSAPKSFLVAVGIGRQVHHVVPYAEEGHRGPLVPICSHCHVSGQRPSAGVLVRAASGDASPTNVVRKMEGR